MLLVVKDVKRCDLLDKTNKLVTKYFSWGATNDIKSHIQSTVSSNSGNTVLYCGTNDLRQGASALEIGKKILKIATYY